MEDNLTIMNFKHFLENFNTRICATESGTYPSIKMAHILAAESPWCNGLIEKQNVIEDYERH